MAPVKYKFNGVAKLSATLVFTALASQGWGVPLTTGIVGKFVFWLLTKHYNWMANQGLALANIGADLILVTMEQGDYDSAISDGLKKVLATKRKLTKEEVDAINAPVKAAARKFFSFV